MTESKHIHLTRRERQIMDAMYRLGSGSVADILAELPDPPGYSAVRAMLRRLEEKGHLRHEEDGPRYIYRPTVRPAAARDSALRRLIDTFFEGSEGAMLAALVDRAAASSNPGELDRIAEMIVEARTRGH